MLLTSRNPYHRRALLARAGLLALGLAAGVPLVGAELREGMSVDPITAMAKPAKGVFFTEPAYGTRMVRVTDHATEPPNGFARNDYSRRQAFNADNSLQLIIANDGFWHLYRTDTNQHVSVLTGLAGDAEPQWHPTNPDLLYYLPTNGVGMQVREQHVRTGASRVVGDLAARLRARWPTAAAAWTKAEGSPSADGRYWCLMVDDGSWNSLGVICWDLQNDQILGFYNTAGDRPDHVSMSPTGTWCEVSGDGALGTVAFSRDFSQRRTLLHVSQHSDLALSAAGEDMYVAVDYQANAGDVFMVNMRTGVRTDLFPTYLAGTATALHISGKAFAKPGWVLVSTYLDGGGDRQWLHRKLFAVELRANPRIYQLAHHRTVSNGYFTEPVASVNRDFTRVVFNSTWGVASTTDLDTYRIELAADALPTLTTADRTPPATPSAPSVSGGSTATPTLSGVTEAGATVRIYDGGVLIATATANGSGAWSVTLPSLGAGSHTLTVTASDASGNTSTASPAVVVTSPGGGSAPAPVAAASGSGSSCGLGGVAAAMIMLSIAGGRRLRRR